MEESIQDIYMAKSLRWQLVLLKSFHHKGKFIVYDILHKNIFVDISSRRNHNSIDGLD